MLNTLKTGWNWTGSKLRDVSELARFAILGCLGVITLMWLINIWWNPAINGFFGLIGLVLVVFITLSPKILLPSAAVGGLSALLSRSNPVRGALNGPLWVVSIARAFVYGFLFFATFLTFWSFENSPFAFWGIFLLALMMFIWRERYGNGLSMMKWIEWSYIMVCGLALLWSTFGGVYHGDAFDANTGEPLSMVDQKTGHIDDAGRQPSDCRPYGAPHKGFDYAARGTCFSKETGERLVPISADQALLRQPLGIVSEATNGARNGIANISLPIVSSGAGGCDIKVVRVLATQPGVMGTQFSMKRGCPIKLDASAFQIPGQPRIGITVKLNPTGPTDVLALGEATLYHAEPWVIDTLGRPYITIVPNEDWPEGVGSIKLIAFSNDTK